MSLGTFGAIMGFASRLVGDSAEIYKAAMPQAKDAVLKETLRDLWEQEKKNYALMEQTRRENVVEMVLEPIAGLHPDDYQVDVRVSDQAGDEDLLEAAHLLEEKERRFFSDSSKKVSLPEVARVFRKIALKKERNIARLDELARDRKARIDSKVL